MAGHALGVTTNALRPVAARLRRKNPKRPKFEKGPTPEKEKPLWGGDERPPHSKP